MTKLNTLDWVAIILVVIGGLNWGLVTFNYNLVEMLFGVGSMLTTIVYGLVGLSALYMLYVMKKLMSPAM